MTTCARLRRIQKGMCRRKVPDRFRWDFSAAVPTAHFQDRGTSQEHRWARNWRRGSESNRRCSFCRAVPYHLATPPSVRALQIKGMIDSSASRVLKNVESHRKTGLQNHVLDGLSTTPKQLHQGSLPNQESFRSSPRPLILDGFRSSRRSRHASVDPSLNPNPTRLTPTQPWPRWPTFACSHHATPRVESLTLDPAPVAGANAAVARRLQRRYRPSGLQLG